MRRMCFLLIVLVVLFSSTVFGAIWIHDTSFKRPVCSKECGNQLTACGIAVFTGIAVNRNETMFLTNVTAISEFLKHDTGYNKRGTTHIDKMVDSFAYIWGNGP